MIVFDVLIWVVKVGSIAILATVWARFLLGQRVGQQRWSVLTLFLIQFGGLVVYYVAWWQQVANDPKSVGLLWPRSDYFVRHMQTDVTSLLVGWLVSLALLFVLGRYFVRRGKGRMLDGADVGQLFLLSAAVGWPGMFIAMGMVFVLAVVLMFLLVLLRKKSLQDRLIISPVILPAAMVTILFQDQLLALTHLSKIGF